MSAERPTIASCPHCRAILLRTQRALIHPTGSEREEIERALGPFWFQHSTTRFDGRFHRCLGREPVIFSSGNRKSNDELHESSRSVYRGPHRDIKNAQNARRTLLAVAFLLSVASTGNAQQTTGVPRQHPRFPVVSEPTEDVVRSLKHFSTHRLEAGRQPVDPCVLLASGTAEVGNEPAQTSADAARHRQGGSWQGMELASGRYQILDTLRQAAAGVVYLAHDRNLDADVVVEVPSLPPIHNPESKARFLRAVRSGARLVHPHLVKITEVGTLDDAPYVVAEHRAGGSLRFRRPVGPDGRPAPVAPRSLEQWLPDVSDALDYLHACNRFSREVSLANILFDENGHASLGGLGIAVAITEWLGPSSEGLPINHGRLAGPSLIVAPEIASGAPADGQTDQYALAATVYELLSGHSPFDGPSLAGVFEKETSIDPPELREVCPTISQALASAVHRGLSRDPQDRFPDCKAFAQAVVTAAREPGPVLDPGAKPANLARTDWAHAKTTPAGLPVINRREITQASHLVLGVACGFLIVVIGATARRKRSGPRTDNQPLVSPRGEVRPFSEPLSLTSSAEVDRKPRSLNDTTLHGTTRHRRLGLRRHTTEVAGRPHLSPTRSILPAQSTGQELVRLPDLDPLMDRPKTRLADNLLPVVFAAPTPSASLPQKVGKRPLTPSRRRAS